MTWTTCPIVMIDTETTGLTWITSRVVEVGATAFRLSENPLEPEFLGSFRTFIHPGSRALEGHQARAAMQVNQIAPMDLEGAPTFLEAARELEGFLTQVANESGCGQLALAAYNAEFDFRMLAAEWLRCGLDMPLQLRMSARGDASGWVDPLVWCRDACRDAKDGHSLSAQRKRLALPSSGPIHRALTDAVDAAKIFNWLTLGGHQDLTNSRIQGTPFGTLDELLSWQAFLLSGQIYTINTNKKMNNIKKSA